MAGSTRMTSGEIAAARAYRTALVCGRLRRARSRSAPRSRVHRRPLCRGIARCFPAWNDQARVERPDGSWSVCILTSLWFGASYACRKSSDRVQWLLPTDARFARIAVLKRGVSEEGGWEIDTALPSSSEPSQPMPTQRSGLARLVQIARAAAFYVARSSLAATPDYRA